MEEPIFQQRTDMTALNHAGIIHPQRDQKDHRWAG